VTLLVALTVYTLSSTSLRAACVLHDGMQMWQAVVHIVLHHDVSLRALQHVVTCLRGVGCVDVHHKPLEHEEDHNTGVIILLNYPPRDSTPPRGP
jgi:hypothetical protein